ncbi:sulfatase-like hydrolase/transferase [Brachybacterium kimchii]|uniref:Sulfatase-like hydrolase/transferase n=1 Tax=Brachybacterium kimchii TaxID=2942909 RepID=A0ABY4N771_9MICO|nr:sulfatase-like hydrolase/transferase [Brachybacterium kimchii]UQN29288.1 sulfatase-like hydrolase/transferase [Brachybacterium kimchii]
MTEPSRPNIVIVFADDLGWGDLGCFGAEDIPTPHLDALCAAGVRLPQWYANSPVCSPSRAALMTGRYPAHAGVESILGGTRRTPGLPHQPTLASHLRERGYRTGLFGKWHLGADPAYAPARFGFDETFGFRAGCVDYYSHIFYWGDHNPVHDLWDGDDEVWRNGEYLTTVIGDRAAEFITRTAPESPFFCYVPFNAPHYPMHAPDEHMRRVDHLPPGRRESAAMIAAMDDAVGEILAALDRSGVRDDTIVLFSSDNGPSRESRNWLDGEEISYTGGSAGGLRGSKGSVFEGGIRVPGIVSWPAQLRSGAEYDQVGTMMDLLPTLLHAVDGEEPELPEVDGISLLDALRAEGGIAGGGEGDVPSAGESAERAVVWEYQGQYAVRRGRFKLVHDAREGMDPPAAVSAALFDLETDPQESTDVSGQAPRIVADLERVLSSYQEAAVQWEQSRRDG